ncbi:hypothetical protein HDV00_004335 [Rhizophlyctis rosea]|nr:hypothetical protein HDV00_004335 [Rhizophlyctis rosea]
MTLLHALDPLRINTTNALKLSEFQKYLTPRQIIPTQKDILEPLSTCPYEVVQYKASQFPPDSPTLIDDTSLDIDGYTFGANIKNLLSQLPRVPDGTKATFVCLLGLREHDKVFVYRGEVGGRIVQPPRGQKYGFLAYFCPDGTDKTLGEVIEEKTNARWWAVKALLEGTVDRILPVQEHWDGDFQLS